MSEYWVSKKQYWCKYCNIWIRDDAPSRSLHESGGKHQGNKERYIRDIYRNGERAKREKDANAREFARIEAAAAAAHAKDIGGHAGRPAPGASEAPAPSSSRPRAPKASGDKWSNYSSSAQLGFDDEETKLSSFEIEQMVRGRGTAVGKWEAVVEEPQQQIVHGEHGLPMTAAAPPVAEDNDPNHENFKFRHKDKRPVHDVYDDDEWDSAALGSIKLKSKERKIGHEPEAAAEAGKGNTGWSKIGKAKEEVKEEVKTEGGVEAKEEVKTEDAAPSAFKTEPAVTDSNPVAEVKAEPEAEVAPASGSLFKKRRPPPSSRKK